MSKKRPYTLKKRAESQERTRQRIVEATMRLHENVGPRATTIRAIAEEAGVQRLTVYRHFPDETAVFKACTAHWLSLNPLPDPAEWSDIETGRDRARAALAAFYAYYRSTERMWHVSFRDVEAVPALQEPMNQVQQFLHDIGTDLVHHFEVPDARREALAVTIHHALAFSTWSSLKSQGLDDKAMQELACLWIEAAQASRTQRGEDSHFPRATRSDANTLVE